MSINSGLKANFELRAIAREKLKGKWLYAVLVCLIAGVLSSFGCIPVIGFIITLLISGPLALGMAKYFLKLRRDENPELADLFDGFKAFSSAFLLQLLIIIFVILWSLLLIIPGIIAALSYAMSFYILYDHPEMKPGEIIKLSKQMMAGRKGKLFLLGLSFIGWALLCIVTLGIGFLWLTPYFNAAIANFYEDVKGAPLASGAPNKATTA
ncbi:MAG: DUF975 family protein [Bacillota bacterium]